MTTDKQRATGRKRNQESRGKNPRRLWFAALVLWALGIEVSGSIVARSRDRAPKIAQSLGLGPPSFMCGVHYGRVFAVLGTKALKKREKAVLRVKSTSPVVPV